MIEAHFPDKMEGTEKHFVPIRPFHNGSGADGPDQENLEVLLCKKSVSFGLGNMGRGMCDNIIKNGYPMTLFDLDPEKSAYFKGRAAIAASSLAVFQAADVVFLSLPNSDVVESVVNEFLDSGTAGKNHRRCLHQLPRVDEAVISEDQGPGRSTDRCAAAGRTRRYGGRNGARAWCRAIRKRLTASWRSWPVMRRPSTTSDRSAAPTRSSWL